MRSRRLAALSTAPQQTAAPHRQAVGTVGEPTLRSFVSRSRSVDAQCRRTPAPSFLEELLAFLAKDRIEPDAAERACLQATVAAIDVLALLCERDGGPLSAESWSALPACIPDL